MKSNLIQVHFCEDPQPQTHYKITGDISELIKEWYLTLSFQEQKKLFLAYGWNCIELSKKELDRVWKDKSVTDSSTKSTIEWAFLGSNFPPTNKLKKGECNF